MLLRFIIENIASFKDATEFNTFPSSKTHSHETHKVVCGHTEALRLSAIYGANGAGKSNLFGALNFLKLMVEKGIVLSGKVGNNIHFMFDGRYIDQPSGLAIEFFNKENVYYYHIEIKHDRVLLEELYISNKTKDIPIFIRNDSSIEMNKKYWSKGFNQQFVDALGRLVRPDMLLLSFMGKNYFDEIPALTDAYRWFIDVLEVVLPSSFVPMIPQMLDSNEELTNLINMTVPELSTGVSGLKVKKEIINEENVSGNETLLSFIKQAKANPGIPQVAVSVNGEVSNIVCENNEVYMKRVVAVHNTENGNSKEMPLMSESDGTRRMIEYMPLLYSIIKGEKVYVVDEMERSIHPILIKNFMSKLSEIDNAKGQLIFTTHESALLDQKIFRPDEIWFAQKDSSQATQLYPLSDFNIHKTANIENGYLDGRYGAIPFLSNLKDLSWNL